jgi:NTP pyrophosphatase (non-canonical NTP hydrolase)
VSAGPYSIGSDVWPGLAKLAEECGELVQVLGKIIAMGGEENYDHWDGTNLRVRLIEEMGDVRGAMIFLCEQNGIRKQDVHERADQKLELFRTWQGAQSWPPPRIPPSEGEVWALLMRIEQEMATEDDRVVEEWRQRHPQPASLVRALSVALRNMTPETRSLVRTELISRRF